MASGGKRGGRADSAPPLGIKLCPKDGAVRIPVGQLLLHIEGIHRMWERCLRKLDYGKTVPYWSHGTHPHGPGHRHRAYSRPGHWTSGGLLINGRRRITSPCPQDNLPPRVFCQDLPWLGSHALRCMDLSPRCHYQWSTVGWLLSHNRLASCGTDLEGEWWQVALGYAATHCAAIWRRPPPAPSPHVNLTPSRYGPRPT